MESIDELRNEIRILQDNNIDTDELVRIADAIEREVEERYIEGPTDRYGEPVHLGDVLQCERAGGGWCEPFEVHHLTIIEPDSWYAHEECGYGHIARLCRHNLTTVEDVLQEFVLALDKRGHLSNGVATTIAEYAPKLRLANNEE